MLKLNKKVEYGLMALLHMDGRELSSVREMADAYHIPAAVLGKVMQMLAHQNLIESTLGAHGGYHLNKSVEEINLMQVHEAIEGPVHLTCCQGEDVSCPQFTHCNIKDPMSRVQRKLLDFISDLKVSDFRQVPSETMNTPSNDLVETGVAP